METVKVICKENKRLGWKIINKEDMTKADTEYKEKPARKTKKEDAKDSGIV